LRASAIATDLDLRAASALSTMIVSIPDPNRGAPFTDPQGQYLAFIYAYAKIHRRPPAEADMQRFFGVTAPSVHRIVLEKRGLIHREPGKARRLTLLVAPEELPILR
jgi:DNA-binding MarR family transcriptional regulator